VAEPEPPILEIRDLSKEFPVLGAFGRVKARLKAVDGVSFALPRGEVLGLVGESGCGKSTLGKTIMGIHEPSAGEVLFQGRRIAGGGVQRDNAMRARVQYAYQDPGASLDPRWKLRDSLHEPLIVHTDWSREKRCFRAAGSPAAGSSATTPCARGSSTRIRTLARRSTRAGSCATLFTNR
jgi:ABC-type glutathione transport system ATPase component